MSNKQEQVLDPESMSMDELRKLAEAEAAEPAEPQPQPRDDKGRFAAPKQDEEPEPTPEEPPSKTVYRRQIDLGDGSGVQVFEADSVDGLVDKLVKAQENATRKIREQQQKLREIEESQQQVSDDDEFVLSQELMSRPSEAIKKAFKKMTGYDISEFKTVAERAKALDAAQAQRDELRTQEDASTEFVKNHPDYLPNEANGRRLVKAVHLVVAEAKAKGESIDYAQALEDAYKDLSESGLLQLKSEEDEPEPAPARPASPPASAPRRSSSLSSRARSFTPPKSTEPSEEDLYSMPLDKLRELAEKEARGQ